jgi:hydrogenase maturation protease
MTYPKTIVIGLGNPILGDDGAGWKVIEFLAGQLPPDIEVDCLAGGGLSVMERLVGFDRAIIVDALNTGKVAQGGVQVFSLEELSNPFLGHLGSAHETNLQTALELGRRLGAHLPEKVWIVGIESLDIYDFNDTLSRDVAAAVPLAAQRVLDVIFLCDQGQKNIKISPLY